MASDQNHSSSYASTVPLNVPLRMQPFIGIPYLDQGYSPEGVCCIGLVHLVLKSCCGISINPYADISMMEIERANEAFAAAVDSPEWLRVIGEPKMYDIALMRGDPYHCGIVVAPRTLLHVWRAPASVAMAFDHPLIRARIIGFYRHIKCSQSSD